MEMNIISGMSTILIPSKPKADTKFLKMLKAMSLEYILWFQVGYAGFGKEQCKPVIGFEPFLLLFIQKCFLKAIQGTEY
jgi:hypothetical protein